MFVRKRDEFLQLIQERVCDAVVHVNAIAPPRFGSFRIWSFPAANSSTSVNNNNNGDDELKLGEPTDWVSLVDLQPPFEALCELRVSAVVQSIERSFNTQHAEAAAEEVPEIAEQAHRGRCASRSGVVPLSAAVGACAVILTTLLLAVRQE